MTTSHVPGALIAAPDPAALAVEASRFVARALRDAIAKQGHATIALSGGETPRATYEKLASEEVDFTKVSVFFVDERAGSPESTRSNYHMVRDALLVPARIAADHVYRMAGEAGNLDEAAKVYEQLLKNHVTAAVGGLPAFDLVVLGIGDDGHTASLFPRQPYVRERERHVLAIPAAEGREARLTLTAPVLEHALETVVLAQGAKKTPALERAWLVTGNIDDTPARIVRSFTGRVSWIVDREAAGLA